VLDLLKADGGVVEGHDKICSRGRWRGLTLPFLLL
jgi:hypothetical protein